MYVNAPPYESTTEDTPMTTQAESLSNNNNNSNSYISKCSSFPKYNQCAKSTFFSGRKNTWLRTCRLQVGISQYFVLKNVNVILLWHEWGKHLTNFISRYNYLWRSDRKFVVYVTSELSIYSSLWKHDPLFKALRLQGFFLWNCKYNLLSFEKINTNNRL